MVGLKPSLRGSTPYHSPHASVLICFKYGGYQRTAMDLQALRQAERHSGMSKIAKSARTDINIWVETVMKKVACIIVWQVRAMHFHIIYRITHTRSPLWSGGQSSWLQIQRSGFDSRRYQVFF
jgi:hypothetical protein